MYTLTVIEIKTGKTAEAKGSVRRMLLDYLEASSTRNGYEVSWFEPGVTGALSKDNHITHAWEVSE